MKKTILITAAIVVAATLIGIALVFQLSEEKSPALKTESSRKTASAQMNKANIRSQAKRPLKVATPRKTSTVTERQDSEPIEEYPVYEETALEEEVDYPTSTEEIKRQIYALGIEHVEDIDLLDEVVQTGDADTREMWSANWLSVDDWKGEDNGFRLEPQEDGTFKFFPDEETTRTYTFFETPKTYTYDENKKEFYWEVDYYGKIITHKARFINENVLVTMLISGRKVVLDIYEKNPDEETPAELK